MSDLDPSVLAREIPWLEPERARWQALEATLQRFVAELAQAPVDERDERAATRAYVARLAEAGLLRWVVPGAWGGALAQPSALAICLIRQWLARASGALDTAFVMQGLGSFPIAAAGHEVLAARIFPEVAAGRLICGFALTEPEAGSDLKRISTTATTRPDGTIVLRGVKHLISNAGVADGYAVIAKEHDPDRTARPRFSAFWVPADRPGLRVVAQRVLAPHPIGELHFDEVALEPALRLGPPGQGLALALSNLDQFRASVGAAACGLADRAALETRAWLRSRAQFGGPLADQQGLRFRFADLMTAHLAAQLLVYRAAAARDAGAPATAAVAMAKLAATETAQQVVDFAVQAHGGRGVLVGSVPERLYREVRALRIYEGASEIQKLVIARALLDG